MKGARIIDRVERHWRWVLILSFLVLLPTKTLFNIPIGIMSVAGLIIVVRRFSELRLDRAIRHMLILFACIWIPMLLALPDAVNFEHSSTTILKTLRFPFMGVFIVLALREEQTRRWLLWGVFCVLLAWCVDALWQFLSGKNFLGNPITGSRLTGVFHPKYRIGIVLAALSPLYFELVRRLMQRFAAAWLLAVPVILVIVLSGSRAAWVMFAVALSGYLIFLVVRLGRRSLGRGMLLKAGFILALITIASSQFPELRWRVKEASGVFSGDFEVMDLATKRRLSIWGPALDLLKSNWINGVGPRGFRYAFVQTTEQSNFWMQREPPGVTHPHQMFLEIATESGAIGVLGLIGFFAFGTRMLRHRSGGESELAIPSALCVLVAMFPLNVHMAFYASFWASTCWWLVFLFVGIQGSANAAAEPSPS